MIRKLLCLFIGRHRWATVTEENRTFRGNVPRVTFKSVCARCGKEERE